MATTPQWQSGLRFPPPWRQRRNVLCRMVRQAGDEIDQTCLRIDFCVAAVLDQGEEVGQPGAGRWMANREPVLRAQLERADGVFSAIVRQFGFRNAPPR